VPDPIAQRILRKVGVVGLFDALTERISPSDLHSLLLTVYRKRAEGLTPADVLRQFAQSRRLRPAELPPDVLREIEQLAASLLPPGFERIELSPIAPFGAVSAVTRLSQDVALATIANAEVVSDATNVLALEAACRRRDDRAVPVRLAACHRVLRIQVPDTPGALAHFQLLGLAAAGRDQGSFVFELDALREQIDFHVRLLAAAGEAHDVTVSVTDLDGGHVHVLEQGVLVPVARQNPQVEVKVDQTRKHGRGYYTAACFEVLARGRQVVDGGFVDWTQQLLSDRKERLLISGVGLERLAERMR
jgi:hypothetical protein